MKALVTGGAGFIGSHVVENLLARGWEVTVLDDFSSGRRENLASVAGNSNLQIVEGSVLDNATVAETLKDVDTVFHEAAIVSEVRSRENPVITNRVNVEGTLNLIDELRKSDVGRFVFASSCGVYGDAKELPVTEGTPMAPRGPYAASKAAAEQYCMAFHRTYGLHVVCLRYTNVYGPRRSVGPYSGVMIKFAERLLSNQSPVIFGDGEQTRDFVYSTDVAEATVKAAESPKTDGMAMNVGTGIPTSINELARVMAELTGKTNLGVVREEARPGEIRFSQADTGLARRILGFECKVTLREGIKSFLSWYANRAGSA
jgi:UDP-glucose 4-epimerase